MDQSFNLSEFLGARFLVIFGGLGALALIAIILIFILLSSSKDKHNLDHKK